MRDISVKKAFKMGQEAFLQGLPMLPTFNLEFWSQAVKINDHKSWKEVIRAYEQGWSAQKNNKYLEMT